MIAFHKPVMYREVIEYLNLKEGSTIVDATVGLGGHAKLILERIIPNGKLIGIDRDRESLELAKEILKDFQGSFELYHGDFRNLDEILRSLKISSCDGIFFDLGLSSFQLESVERGFSFQLEGPLDMRMDRDSYISAYDLVNNLKEKELSSILRSFGQERYSNRIVRLIVKERKRHPIATTRELTKIILQAVPYRRRYQRIHPATRTFQALRIAVNRELEALEEALRKTVDFLNRGARICVISFHSLEDKIAKEKFRYFSSKRILKIITSKPLMPSLKEISENPRSRSAKLRVAERI